MHSPRGIYRARVLNICTIRLYVGVKRQRHTITTWEEGRRGSKGTSCERRPRREGGRDETGKREDRGRESGGAREEAKKRLARPFYFETSAQCSGRSVAQNSVLSVLQPLPDAAASRCKHSDTLNTSRRRVLSQ